MKFTYNNTKNINIEYMIFKRNYRYYLYIFLKKNVKFRSNSKIANELIKKFKNFIALYRENLQYT